MALKWSSVGAVLLLSDFIALKAMKTYRIANHRLTLQKYNLFPIPQAFRQKNVFLTENQLFSVLLPQTNR